MLVYNFFYFRKNLKCLVIVIYIVCNWYKCVFVLKKKVVRCLIIGRYEFILIKLKFYYCVEIR